MATAKRKFFAHSKQQSESAAASFEESSVFTKSNRKTGVNLRYETQFDPTFERMEPRILLSADLLGGAISVEALAKLTTAYDQQDSLDQQAATLLHDITNHTNNSNTPSHWSEVGDTETTNLTAPAVIEPTAISIEALAAALDPSENISINEEPEDIFSADFDSLFSAENSSDSQPIASTADILSSNYSHQLIVVDTSIENYQALVDDISDDEKNIRYSILLIDSNENGIESISRFLSGTSDISAIHIVSHGTTGEFQLGNFSLSNITIQDYANDIESWANSLTEGADLLVYSCNVAADEYNLQLLSSLHELSGADVAASDDLTGSSELSADWELEYQLGEIESAVIFSNELQSSWQGTLATYTVNTTDDTIDINVGDGLALDANGNTSLRAAIMEANASKNFDRIEFSVDGTFVLTGLADENSAVSGDLNINEALQIIGNGQANTIIDGNAIDRVFEINNNAASLFQSLTIQNGYTEADGGGIRVGSDAILVLRDVLIKQNYASEGAGIYNTGNLIIQNSSIIENGVDPTDISGASTTDDGGGIYSAGQLSISGSTIEDNLAIEGAGILTAIGSQSNIQSSIVTDNGNENTVQGGGIHNNGTLTIATSEISFNTASYGAGLFNNSAGDLHITDANISFNGPSGDVESQGGGIESRGTLEIERTEINNNFARYGAGIYIGSGTATISDSYIYNNGNADTQEGGGISNRAALTIERTTLANNQADNGGGLGRLRKTTGTADPDRGAEYRSAAR